MTFPEGPKRNAKPCGAPPRLARVTRDARGANSCSLAISLDNVTEMVGGMEVEGEGGGRVASPPPSTLKLLFNAVIVTAAAAAAPEGREERRNLICHRIAN